MLPRRYTPPLPHMDALAIALRRLLRWAFPAWGINVVPPPSWSWDAPPPIAVHPALPHLERLLSSIRACERRWPFESEFSPPSIAAARADVVRALAAGGDPADHVAAAETVETLVLGFEMPAWVLQERGLRAFLDAVLPAIFASGRVLLPVDMRDGATPYGRWLEVAVQADSLPIAAAVLAAGCPPIHDVPRGTQWAAVRRPGGRIDVDARPLHWIPCLPSLFHARSAAMVRLLVSAGADPARSQFRGQSLLFHVRRVDVVAALVAAGLDPAAKDVYGNTPLQWHLAEPNPQHESTAAVAAWLWDAVGGLEAWDACATRRRLLEAARTWPPTPPRHVDAAVLEADVWIRRRHALAARTLWW